MPDYRRTADELSLHASMFWPPDLSKRASELSIIPTLLDTQDQFIAILSVEVPDIQQLFEIVNSSKLSANLFLKHLVVLADVGGEMLQRINNQFNGLFPTRDLVYLWNGEKRSYHFKYLPISGTLNNSKLGIGGKELLDKQALSDLHRDVIALLLLAGASTDEHVAEVLAKCEISDYLGQPSKLEKFIKQRYIWVSRITGGARSNSLGQFAQQFVAKYLAENLAIENVTIKTNGHVPGVTHTDEETNRLTNFDIVASKGDKHVAIEVSFQVTTNSVIERKSGQARARYQQIERAGQKIAYVLDGAGNFQRKSALGTICAHSHCTVAFSREELDVLCQFIREHFELEN